MSFPHTAVALCVATLGWLQASPVAAAAEPAPLAVARRLAPPDMQAIGQGARIKAALVQLSREHPDVQSAQAAADTSSFEIDAARSARYPRLKVGTASGSYDSGVQGTGSRAYQLVTADLRMSLLDGGAMSARVRAAEFGSEAGAEAVKSTSQKVVLDALTAYLQVQRFDLKKQIARKSTEVLDELARAERRRIELGAAGENDLRMATSRRAGIAAREMDFEAQRGEALAKFATFFRFTPDTAHLPVIAVPLQWQPASEAEALLQAEDRSSELAEARGRVQRAQATVEQYEASAWPTVDAVLVKTKDPRGVSPSEPTRAALELNWNFGNGFDRQVRVKAAIAEVANQEARLESARQNLVELTSASWARTAAGREREKQLRAAVTDSGLAFQGRRRLLAFGRETLPNVLDAQVEYYTLLLDYVDAVFDLRVTELRLQRTAGRLLVAPDSDNLWIDSLIAGAPRPVLTEESLLAAPCIARVRCEATAVSTVATGSPVAGLALRRSARLGSL
ncbi:TolC family protein [Variovorax boronicumulans]|uniref:TolC family protein n=1 Tax=Variovorax boronicumulans TaxID=436515 RepID=UPI00214CF991